MNKILSKALLLTCSVALTFSAAAQDISVRSSDTILQLSQGWIKSYSAKHADVKLEIMGGPATNAFVALAEKKSQLAIAPRSIRYKEAQACEAVFGQRPTEFKLAVNGVAIYVNSNNPVKVLIYDELDAIYRGKSRNWRPVGGSNAPISALGVATSTSVGELFLEEVLGGNALTNDVRILSATEMLDTIARETNAIGFGPLAEHDGVRAVPIKRSFSSTPVAPTPETIANKIYPISRFIFGYIDPAGNQGNLKALLDWIRTDEGQEIGKQSGYFLLPDKWRTTP